MSHGDKERRYVRVPVIEPLDIRTVWEHTPLAYYRYGQYPRFIRPVGAHQPRTEWQRRHIVLTEE